MNSAMVAFRRRPKRFTRFAALVALVIALFPFTVFAQTSRVPPPKSVSLGANDTAERVPYKPGDICAQCGHAIGKQDPVYLVHGHRIPLHRNEMQADLAGQLERLASRYEPAGAFLQAAARETGLSPAWFLIGCYVLLGLIFAALCSHGALHKGLPAWQWFLAGLFLNIGAYAALQFVPARPVGAVAGVPSGLHKFSATYAPADCPKCGSENHPSARACVECGAALAPAVESEVSRAGLGPA